MPQITVSLTDDLQNQLNTLAKESSHTPEELLLEALDQYLTVKKWQANELELALKEADAGGFASDQEVQDVLARYQS